jgi:two-component system CheB/CheR fusion protein
MTAQDNSGDKGEARKLRVLIADDSSDAADSLALLVQTWGHDVRAVYDGRTVLETAQAYLPDVALLDLGLPGVDGYQLALQFRRTPALHNVVLFAVTGYDWKNAQIRSKEYGFDQHLLKPVDPERLHSLLDALKQRSATPGGGQ